MMILTLKKRYKGIVLLVLTILFLPITYSKAQVIDSVKTKPDSLLKVKKDTTKMDSLKKIALKDSLPSLYELFIADSLLSDSLKQFTLDSLKRDSILKATPSAVVNVSAKKRTYTPLPKNVIYNFVDSANVIAAYYLALEEYFSTTFQQFLPKSIFSVQIGPRNYRTTAFVRAMPIMQAEFEERKEQFFISKAEIMAYQKKQEEYFSKNVDIYVDIKSEFISVTDLNKSLFIITLFSDDISVEPIAIRLQPIYSHISEFKPWYQRRVILQFPRYQNNIDLWYSRKLSLTISIRNNETRIESTYQSRVSFELNPENKIDPKKVMNEVSGY